MFQFFRQSISNKGMSLKEPQVVCSKATFALGCFWGPDAQFPSYRGVIHTRVGYCGGTTVGPTYRNIGDHTETIDIDFDASVITYETLLSKFWANHDPTIQHKRQYMSAIFYHDEKQKESAENSMEEEQKKYARPIVTKIMEAGPFYDAEDYHQKYVLRQNASLFKSLKLEGKALIQSHVAAKLCAFVGGFSSLEEFEKEHKDYGLTEEQISAVRNIIKSGATHRC